MFLEVFQRKSQKKCIMVVFSAFEVREFLAKELQRLNHMVFVTQSGQESLKEYKTLSGVIDFVFLDWLLCDKFGSDCAKNFIGINPSVSVVYICDFIPSNKEKVPSSAEVLLNPIVTSDLQEIVGECI